MRNDVKTILILLVSLSISCNEPLEKPQQKGATTLLHPKTDVNVLENNFMNWWTYHVPNISLSSDFTALNQKSDTIKKEQFLNELKTGTYIPLKLKSEDKNYTYQLFELSPNADKSIVSTIKSEAITSVKYLEMEGSIFPEFSFTDLSGKHYNNTNTKGKTIILKTWFINCAACIAEFPELNEFVEKNKFRDDILFLSLATNKGNDLKTFLENKEFKYQVVPEQKDFIINGLKLQIYPTHIIIDKNGTILKVINQASEMIRFFETH